MRYGIYDENLGWITQGGRVVVSRDPEELRATLPFGEVRRVWLRRTVDLADAFRKSEPRTVHYVTTREGVDQIVGNPLEDHRIKETPVSDIEKAEKLYYTILEPGSS